MQVLVSYFISNYFNEMCFIIKLHTREGAGGRGVVQQLGVYRVKPKAAPRTALLFFRCLACRLRDLICTVFERVHQINSENDEYDRFRTKYALCYLVHAHACVACVCVQTLPRCAELRSTKIHPDTNKP